ncbi:hypothetical protein C8Q76DRAFT_140364 [Earliella scabrosa]|nr:hypothetical protein C8Q76DRAFT_140364 [Earliella scabrosa]
MNNAVPLLTAATRSSRRSLRQWAHQLIWRLRADAEVPKIPGRPLPESEKGVALTPSAGHLKPWYSERDSQPSMATDEVRASMHQLSILVLAPESPTSREGQLTPRSRPSTRSAAPLRSAVAPSVAIPVSR